MMIDDDDYPKFLTLLSDYRDSHNVVTLNASDYQGNRLLSDYIGWTPGLTEGHPIYK